MGRGQVEVKPAGSAEWRKVRPLLAVRAGDTLRATDDASAVILLSGGRGSVKVAAAGSPFVVPAPQPGEGKLQKVATLVDASLGFLTSSARELPRAALGTRGGPRPPVILSPRNGPVLPDSLSFEWLGSRYGRYTIRIVGPSGVALERKGLAGGRLDYPPAAPALAPGIRYTFQVISGSHPPQEVWFEILDPARAQALRRDLTMLEQEFGPTVSPNTLAMLRAAFLAENGLIHDARLLVVGALGQDPDEPTLHFLLANLYAKVGLAQQAAESYEEARFLMAGPPKR